MIIAVGLAALWFAACLTLDNARPKSATEAVSAVIVLAVPVGFIVWLVMNQIA